MTKLTSFQGNTGADGLCPSPHSEDELHRVNRDSDCLPAAPAILCPPTLFCTEGAELEHSDLYPLHPQPQPYPWLFCPVASGWV